jgi:large subunit ribosomal protein L23
MNNERLMKVLLGPVISEKATMVGDTLRQVVFTVVQDATKAEVKAAIEMLFKDQKLEVAAVNMVNTKGKVKRSAKAARGIGRRNNVKKAYISLKGEGDLNLVEGA